MDVKRQANGESVCVFEGTDENHRLTNYGIMKACVIEMRERGQSTRFAQLATIVDTGLPTCQLIYEGIKRPCKADQDWSSKA